MRDVSSLVSNDDGKSVPLQPLPLSIEASGRSNPYAGRESGCQK